MSRIWHIDMDAFFVSVEILKDPTLRGKPVVVGDSGSRGVIAAASYEARRFGVRSAMPSARARQLCADLVFLPGDHAAYAEYHHRLRMILDRYSPRVEAASIDEFCLDLEGCRRLHGNFFNAAFRLLGVIRHDLGLPASIGLGDNRTLAKIASKVAKPSGILEVLPGQEEAFMAPLPVRLIPGVGPAVAEMLARLGVRRAGDLAAVPTPLMKTAFGVCGLELHLKARGLWRGEPVDDAPQRPKSIGHETTFRRDTVDSLALAATVCRLVEKSATRLRKRGLEAAKITVKVRNSDFETQSRAAAMEPTSLEREMTRSALPLLEELTRRRMRVRLVGVTLGALRPSGFQPPLFGGDNSRVMDACRCLDRIKERFGGRAIGWASGRAVPISGA